jgi:hypothetical protein
VQTAETSGGEKPPTQVESAYAGDAAINVNPSESAAPLSRRVRVASKFIPCYSLFSGAPEHDAG